VASNNSSIPEIISSEGSTFGIPKVEPSEENRSAILVDPNNNEEIFWAAYNLISDKALRDDIIKKGLENVKRFSWDKCASEIARMLIDANVKTN
jgi:glycosyltransferase involved in cell wall biosynthesis